MKIRPLVVLALYCCANQGSGQLPGFSELVAHPSEASGLSVLRCGNLRYVFGDEFNTDTPIPDSSIWNYGLPWEEASCVNGELSLNISTRTSTPNMFISNGTLKMQARFQPTQGKYVHWRPDTDIICTKDGVEVLNATTFDYTSAYLVSRRQFRYGVFHIRCRMPYAWGTWPAFWLFGSGQQEIDWFEFIPSKHRSLRTFGYSIHAETAFHTYTQDFEHDNTLFTTPADNLTTGFYDFVGLWDSTVIALYVGKEGHYQLVGKYVPPAWLPGNGPASLINPPCTVPCDKRDNPLWLIISLGVANTENCEPGGCPVRRKFPQTLEVDFVRVYEWQDCEPTGAAAQPAK